MNIVILLFLNFQFTLFDSPATNHCNDDPEKKCRLKKEYNSQGKPIIFKTKVLDWATFKKTISEKDTTYYLDIEIVNGDTDNADGLIIEFLDGTSIDRPAASVNHFNNISQGSIYFHHTVSVQLSHKELSDFKTKPLKGFKIGKLAKKTMKLHSAKNFLIAVDCLEHEWQ